MPAPSLPPAKLCRGKVPPGCPLTPGELAVIQALADGLLIKQIAVRDGKSPGTIRSQSNTAFRRLGASNRTHAIILCWQQGWVTVQGIRSANAAEHEPLAPRVRRRDRVTPEQKLYTDAVVRAVRTGRPDDEQEARVLARIVRRKAVERRAAA